MKKESIYSDAALDCLFEAVVKQFGAHHTWDNRHYPTLKRKQEWAEFCETFHRIIGNKSMRATGMIVQLAAIKHPKVQSKLYYAVRHFAAKNGFIKI